MIQAESKRVTLTFEDVILEHYRLGITYSQTMQIIETLFPQFKNEAVRLWNDLQTQSAYHRKSEQTKEVLTYG